MIRVLIAEDSASSRAYLEHVVNAASGMEVVAVASNGEEAAALTCELRPDVVAMDIHMPVLDGYSATRKIMATCPTPVVIVSSLVHTAEAQETFRIMEVGAVAAVPKPSGPTSKDAALDCGKLLRTLRQVAAIDVSMNRSVRAVPSPCAALKTPSNLSRKVVVIGASTGGPVALQTLLRQLPANFPLPVVIVQHISPGFMPGMVEWLKNSCALPLSIAQNGERIESGRVYFAPDHLHMGLTSVGRIFMNDDPPLHNVRPAVSFLFQSVAKSFGGSAVGVLLTGMGRDGAAELLTLKKQGCPTLIQDQQSCVVYGMPGEAEKLGAGDYQLPPEAIGRQLVKLCQG